MSILDLLCRQREFNRDLHTKRRRLHRVACAWCRDISLADDLVQETLTKGYKNLASLRNVQAMDTWLFDILRNCWRDHLRRSRDMEDIDDYLDIMVLEDENERSQVINKVRDAVYKLPMAQREVLSLVDLAGFSYAEVSGILQIPVGTVTSRISRGRNTLKKLLFELEIRERDNVVHLNRANKRAI